MPPPPPGVTGKKPTSNRSSDAPSSSHPKDDGTVRNGHAQSAKGKGKADDPIELNDDTDSPGV